MKNVKMILIIITMFIEVLLKDNTNFNNNNNNINIGKLMAKE